MVRHRYVPCTLAVSGVGAGFRPEAWAVVMFLEAARNLFVPELVRVLDEKLVLECVRSREYPLPPVVPTTSLESHVSISWALPFHSQRMRR